MTRRLSLPQTPISTPLLGPGAAVPFASSLLPFERRQWPLRPNKSLTCLNKEVHSHNVRVRLSQPDLCTTMGGERFPVEMCNQATRPRLLPTPKNHIPKRFLKRSNQSDLATRFQKHADPGGHSNESTPSREIGEFTKFSGFNLA